MSKKPNTKAGSVQALLGMLEFTEHGIRTSAGELVCFRIEPTNISVLSSMLVEQRLNALTDVLKLPNLEFVCCDSQQNFTANKLYLKKRMSEETTPEIRALLHKDNEFLDNIQSNMATSREFLCILRLKATEGIATITNVEKQLDAHGFFPTRLEKDDLKRLIGRYFGYYSEIPLPDYDGAQYL